jgi:hypothetical protein
MCKVNGLATAVVCPRVIGAVGELTAGILAMTQRFG